MKIKLLKIPLFFILGTFISLFPVNAETDNPPLEEIRIIYESEEPSEDLLILAVYFNPNTGLITIETEVNRWIYVCIYNSDNGTIYSIDVIDPSYNYGSAYYTSAPSLPGNYCIQFQSATEIACGYFTIN